MAETPIHGSRKPFWFVAAGCLVTVSLLLGLAWSAWRSYRALDASVRRSFEIQELRGRIVYLDEVLTMSARVAAATGDLSWEKRYKEHLPLILKAIDQAMAFLPDFKGLKQTESANAELDLLEGEAFQQIHAGHPEKARELLFGTEYARNKQIYAQGMQALGQQLQEAAEATTRVEQRRALVNFVAAVGAVPPLIAIWLIILRVLRRWRRELLANHQHLSELNKDLDQKVATRTAQLAAHATELEGLSRMSQERAALESSLSALNTSLRGNLTVAQAAEKGLASVVEHLGAPMGALFVLAADGLLHRLAAYAYPDDSTLPRSFAIGSGVVGQAAQSRRPILSDPDLGRLTVQFGFGAVSPAHILAFPLSANDTVLGVMELCLFKQLTEAESSWIEKVSETLANSLRFALEREERRQAEERTRLILESTGQGIYGIDLQGCCTFLNRAMAELIGVRPEEILGQNMHALVHHHRFDGSLYPVDQCPVYRAFKLGESCRVDDEVIWRRDGTPIPVEYSSFPILENATVTGAVITVVDITERRRAEEKVRESEQLFRSIFENAQIGINVFKIDRQELSPNRAMQEMLGYTEKELGSLETWDELSYPDERAACAERYAELVEGKRDRDQWEQRLIRKDGTIATTSVRFSLLRDAAGRPQYVAALQEDITERKRLEADLVTAKEVAEAATKAKSDFLANMSHEIRTPMNAIIGMTHLALKTDLSKKQADYLTKVKSAAHALLGIINDILDFSKIEAGKLDMEKTSFRLEDVLDNLSSIVGQKAQDKNLEFLIAAQHDLPPNLVGDSLRLGQILINLVNNAIKFTDQGEVIVALTKEEEFAERVKLKFSVRDSGIGMTPEQTARLFQAFSQADTSTTRKYGGTGLGLSISKRLVEMMEGSIWVESEAGVGSTFHFTAWFGVAAGTAKQKRFIPDLAGTRLLIVDDNAQAREILTDAVQAFAIKADAVSSGENAIRQLVAKDETDPYKLVLMDWHMPGMDGLEASRIIKLGGRLKNIPKIVIVTAFGREDIRAQAETIGVEGYLLKPINASLLYDTLMDLFGLAGEMERSHRKEVHAKEYDATGIRILLVEDNEMNQQVATELLESAGAIVTVANHGAEAVNILTEGDQVPPFDVAFMDLQMPEMDGFTATKLLRRDPRLQKFPIIAMTAHALVEERQRCLDAGMNDHVSKPIDPDALFATLKRWTKPRPKPAVKPQAQLAPTTIVDNVVLPEISGINLADGLKRVVGNRRLYRNLLEQFAQKQGDAARQISAALESGDSKLAERIAHTVKGVAGNLSITEVQSAAQKVEKAIRDGQNSVPALLEVLATVMDTQVHAIQQALGQSAPIRQEVAQHLPFNGEAAAAAIARLKSLLVASDGNSEEAFRSLEEVVAGAVEKPHLDALNASINDFDFEAALVRLDAVAEQCCTKDRE